MATIKIHLGAAAYGRSHLARAAVLLEEALALLHDLGEQTGGVWWATSYLALVACARGDLAAAAAGFAANLDWCQKAGYQESLVDTLAGVAALAASGGAYEQAARLFGAAGALRDLLGHAFLLPERDAFEQGARAARGALGEAAFAAAAAGALPPDQAVAEAVTYLATVAELSRTLPPAPADAAGLTPREVQVLRLLADGLTDQEIAAALFVGPGTVRTHLTRLYGKLGVGSRTAAVAAARRLGLL
jgi:ATP/maltotriose-dependent transcriptional regulator MalT